MGTGLTQLPTSTHIAGKLCQFASFLLWKGAAMRNVTHLLLIGFDPSIPIKPYTIESNEKFAPLAVLDCRGLELVGFSPKVSLPEALLAQHLQN